ncbi:hypothetical protein JCGZ_23178 [Jatropha curcas]|uniref:RING-type domain-containing protein n=2 Tax=Jatropha curcas TaxID=180498 RepID=A0A067JTM0_JATCU|nr:E3 ubiquitin-protein ligase HEL2 isoform X2 [Jatropha curcas]XP_020540385.1 E3 ubiquitin-protein ligase HEL2 isoform X2 [Jatropha curcas]XP_020540386.1 E3 ubiquitin-protein ligase HEL2 isoform X2 [Jatropha curcas]KDP23345.1 hypothetical protein JCGZ_23178 [Jatropha curcas]
MDDSCAVCAETLEWVAYGPCAHREVCSTCIIRLRFICNDQCCCICKSESSVIFVTKAMGDYTRMINDFSALPANPIEGQVGQYWFHEGTQAYFDDLDHYNMIKAMCRLSCIVCDKRNEQSNGGSKRIGDFNNIEQLKIHLSHEHRLFMCSLCLEGRKIFISEQKLYDRAQLSQHVKTGDSVVDGSESERGGFMGHPTCKFCHNPFYGDNELYSHMSTEHFTCHICQRQHPGQYEYYNDYNDLENHFRQGHFLCEDEACLAKKFIVFASEPEMKRHGAMEHGGRMSRSKRNAALQIPMSFRYQWRAEQDRRHRDSRNHSSSSSMTMQVGLETANAVRFDESSLNTQAISNHRGTCDIDSMFKTLATTDSEAPSRSCQALSQNSTGTLLEESSFPPLPMAPSSSVRRIRNAKGGMNGNTMAARLRNQNTVKVLNGSGASRTTGRHSTSSASLSYQSRPVLKSGHLSSSSSPCSSQNKPGTSSGYVQSSHASSIQSVTSTANVIVSSFNGASSSRTKSNTSKISPSSSATNLVEIESRSKSISNSQDDKVTTNSQLLLKVEDVRSANKILVEKIRSALDLDNDKFAAFKILSVEYNQDLIDTGEYLAYVHQFGLSHLVLELAMLCPNTQKQRELVEIHKYNTRRNGSNETGLRIESEGKKNTKKGKELCEDNGSYSSENNLQFSHKEADHMPHSVKGKSKILFDAGANLNSPMELKIENDAQSNSGCLKKNVGPGGGGNKPRKKMSKFLTNRLGDSSATAFPDDGNPDEKGETTCLKKNTPRTLPVHGVWRNGGGRRLVVMSQRDPTK